jgi:uncharacterized protein (TIGR01319 family)
MDDKRLLIDFGSTYTKIVYVDLSRQEIISRAQHLSTVESDITVGLNQCLKIISDDIGINPLTSTEAFACSSAGGGLRIACIGFVPEYSSEAANRAALGAGAKVVGCYSYEITRREIEKIETLNPDIILLTGGTDGGDKKVIIHNARMLASRSWDKAVILVAGNKAAADDIHEAFKEGRHRVVYSDNVMPDLGRLDVELCNRKIRDIFINRIVGAKGLGKVKELIKNALMPTPSAVLEAARLLADGYGNIEGLGELMVIDIGGATTDVHSVAEGKPTRNIVNQLGLPEPYVKRTVEGDLGLRFNLERLIEIAQEKGGLSNMGQVAQRFRTPGYVPIEEDEVYCHAFLTRLAVEIAVNRHVGRIDVKYGPMGEALVQYGKDFTQVGSVLGTGGPVIFSKEPQGVLAGAVSQEDSPRVLKPRGPKLYLDAHYILYAGGLLSQSEPERALRFMKKQIKEIST